MKDARGIRAYTQRHEHVSKLRDRGVGKHTFDVVLHKTHRCRKNRSECSDRHNDGQRDCRLRKQGSGARHHIDSRSDHRCSVDQGAYRRGAFHCIGEPNIQRKLRRFSDRSAEKPQTGSRDDCRRNRRSSCKYFLKRNGTERYEYCKNADQKSEITDAVYDKRFFPCVRRAFLFKPEPDQKIRTESHQLPAYKQQNVIVGQYQHQHRKDE